MKSLGLGVSELLEVHPELADEVKTVWLKHRGFYSRNDPWDEHRSNVLRQVLGKLAGAFAESFRSHLDQKRDEFEITDVSPQHVVRRGKILEVSIINARLVWDDDEWAEVPVGLSLWGPEEMVSELQAEFLAFIRSQDLVQIRQQATKIAGGFGGSVVSNFYHPERTSVSV